jgi:tetratricopeptide (TPR) repeat protein
MAKFAVFYALAMALTVAGCSEAPANRAAKHESRGDGYAQQEKFREAVIEYKNAVQATPDNSALQWKLAKVAFQAGDPSTSFASLNRVLQLDPTHFDAQWSLGDLHVAAGKLDEAGKIADALLAARPNHPAGHLVRAGVALGASRVGEAIERFKSAVELDRTMVRPILALANIYFAQQELKQAAEWYARAVQADSHSVDARVARGHFLFATGSGEEGRQEFRKAVELSPDQERVRLILADRYAVLGRRADAERELAGLMAEMNSTSARQALAELKLTSGQAAEAKPLVQAILEADAHDPVGLYLKGRIALAENDLLQAAGLFDEAIGRNANLPGVHLYLGLTRLAQGRTDSALDALREAVRLDNANQPAHLALARAYLAEQKPVEAEKEAWQALQLNPSNLEAAVILGDALVLGKNWSKAENAYGAIIRQLPGHPVGYVKMAALRKVQGQSAEMASLFSQALSHAPEDLVILQDYLMALVESKQEQQADRVMGEYLRKGARDPSLWRLAGRVYAAQHKTEQAEKAFRKALALAPNLALIHYELGQLYVSQNKVSAAQSAFQAALDKEETNSGVHTALGALLEGQGKIEAADAHYRRAVQLNPKNVVAANNLAVSLSERQELNDAFAFARDALDLAPSNPAIKDTLGWIYLKQGRVDKGYPFLSEASAALPQHPVVRYHHAVALAKIGRQEEALSEMRTALALPGHFPQSDRAARMVAANKIED